MFESIKVLSILIYIVFLLETIFLAGLFTNPILLAATVLSSVIYGILALKKKSKIDILLSIAFILTAIVVIILLY